MSTFARGLVDLFMLEGTGWPQFAHLAPLPIWLFSMAKGLFVFGYSGTGF